MSRNNLPSMPIITDDFLNELVGDIINDVKHETEYIPITSNYNNINDKRKAEDSQQQHLPFNVYDEQNPTSVSTLSHSNNFTLQQTNNIQNKKDNIGSKTMQNWLNSSQLIVHPVWIGNLPPNISTTELRHFIESHIGKVIVSTHINNNIINCNQKTYAFVNLPSAEKQMLVITLFDNKMWNNCKLMVRANKPVKFQQSSFFGNGNSKNTQQHFQRFQDIIIPALKNDISIISVNNILQIYGINVTQLPNRVFGKQCTLIPNCHRKYCSFYHCDKEKELGRIISILMMKNSVAVTGNNENNNNKFKVNNSIKSRHTLLVKGLLQNKRDKIIEMFDVFGDVDTVMINAQMCYVRMKYAQDAKKIVHLFSGNRNGVSIQFALYQSQMNLHLHSQKRPQLNMKSISEPLGQQTYNRNGWNQQQNICSGYYNSNSNGYGNGNGNGFGLNLRNAYSNSDIGYSQNMQLQNNFSYNNNNNNGYGCQNQLYGVMVQKNDNPINRLQ